VTSLERAPYTKPTTNPRLGELHSPGRDHVSPKNLISRLGCELNHHQKVLRTLAYARDSRLTETNFRLNNKPRLRKMHNEHTQDTHEFSLRRVTLA